MNWYEQIHYIGPAFALLLAGVVMTADLIAPRRAPVFALTILVLLVAGLWRSCRRPPVSRAPRSRARSSSTASRCSSPSC